MLSCYPNHDMMLSVIFIFFETLVTNIKIVTNSAFPPNPTNLLYTQIAKDLQMHAVINLSHIQVKSAPG